MTQEQDNQAVASVSVLNDRLELLGRDGEFRTGSWRHKMRCPASGPMVGDVEKDAMRAVVDSGWLTAGAINAKFESALGTFVGLPHVRTCNSGSSANLLAVAAMVEAGLWRRGDEIVTVAAGFPTTINPLLLYGLKPVFVDITLPTYQVDVEQLSRAISHRTRGIMLAHTLGNPFPYEVTQLGQPLVEDCCDALGSALKCSHVGHFGHIATCSFFPAHHITMGEGGAVMTSKPELARLLESLRDWGRDCWCAPGANNTCGARFDQQFGDLPHGYDHKYTFTHLGYNLKITEIQAACGLAQLGRVNEFIEARRRNFALLRRLLEPVSEQVVLPEVTSDSSPSWFGFPITLKEDGLRNALQKYLAQNGVDSRLLFGGNLTRQPYMKGRPHLVTSELRVTNQVMENGLWLGIWPGLSDEDIEYTAHHVKTFLGDFA